jgi:hypothetical protein
MFEEVTYLMERKEIDTLISKQTPVKIFRKDTGTYCTGFIACFIGPDPKDNDKLFFWGPDSAAQNGDGLYKTKITCEEVLLCSEREIAECNISFKIKRKTSVKICSR